MKRTVLTLIVSLLVVTAPAGDAADLARGAAAFEARCAPCHAPGREHPGTMQLELGRGMTNGALELRTDLAPQFVRLVVRRGLGLMPPFRPSELDDETLDALAHYLAAGTEKEDARP